MTKWTRDADAEFDSHDRRYVSNDGWVASRSWQPGERQWGSKGQHYWEVSRVEFEALVEARGMGHLAQAGPYDTLAEVKAAVANGDLNEWVQREADLYVVWDWPHPRESHRVSADWRVPPVTKTAFEQARAAVEGMRWKHTVLS